MSSQTVVNSAQRIGSQRPTKHLLPVGVASLQAGDDAIEFAASIGYDLLDWQCWLVQLILSERVDGSLAAPQSVIIVPRQNGKNVVLEVVELYGLYVQNLKHQVHTAHEASTAALHMAELKERITSDPELDAVTDIYESNGKERIVNRETGGTIWFRTRTKGAKRGSSPQRIAFDEAWGCTDKHLAALVPAMAAQSMDWETLPQMIFTSSAPVEESEVLHRLRKMCMDGRSERTLYVEWGVDECADVTDRDVWYETNPSLGLLISEDYVCDTELEVMSAEDFATERLGVPKAYVEEQYVVPLETWNALVDRSSEIATHRRYALDVSPDRQWAAFAAAGRRADGRLHVEAPEHRPFTKWVKGYAVDLWEKYKLPLRIDKYGPAASFIDPLREAGVEVTEVSTAEVSRACGQFLDACLTDGLRHLGGAALDSALKGAVLRTSGDTALWGRRASKIDISSLVAVTVAVGGVPIGRIDLAANVW